MEHSHCLSRRRLLRAFGGDRNVAAMLRPRPGAAQPAPVLTRPIPSTGEELPAVGLGSWITFNVGDDPIARGSLRAGDAAPSSMPADA